MVCLFCQSSGTRVINSRPHASQPNTWRRRCCTMCHGTFTTYEIPSDRALPPVQSPDTTTQFSRAQLMISLYRDLPDTVTRADDASELASTIVNNLLRQPHSTLTPQTIATAAYAVLRRYDTPSGIRYGSRHGLVDTKML